MPNPSPEAVAAKYQPLYEAVEAGYLALADDLHRLATTRRAYGEAICAELADDTPADDRRLAAAHAAMPAYDRVLRIESQLSAWLLHGDLGGSTFDAATPDELRATLASEESA